MKKLILLFSLFTLLVTLAACGGTSTSADTTNTSTSISTQEELIIGTFRLEDTDLAIDSEQAAHLIPLWQTLQSLTTSGTAASEEIDAVVAQIKSDMTSQQIETIYALNLTQLDLNSIMSENGLTSTSSAAGRTTEPSPIQVSMGNAPAEGTGDPGVAIPGGAGDPSAAGSGQTVSQVQGTTSQSTRSQLQVSSNEATASLLRTLIELLQKKIQA